MNTTTQATAARPKNRQPELPKLPHKQRLGAVIASVLVSTALLSSVVIGLTSSPDSASQMAGRATPATPA